MNPEVAQIEALAKATLLRCLVDDIDPVEVRQWLSDQLARLGGAGEDAILTWPDSFDLVDQMLDQYEVLANTPLEQRKDLSWPWGSWNKIIDPLEPGMLCVIAAPDGAGKTTYSEIIAENWAAKKNKVAFVHYELNRKLMMLRRTSRHTNLTVRDLKSGQLDKSKRDLVNDVRKRLMKWDGNISYVHTPGWTMERTIAELTRLHAEGELDVVVLDYLEKVAASPRQLRMFGNNLYQREADNVEQIKNFSESTDVPVVMVAQMSKTGKTDAIKSGGFENVNRTAMRGAGEKSEKANVVVLIGRERIDEGYSNEVDVLVDKNTMGATGQFKQIMRPEFFQVGDIQEAK